MLKKSAIYGSLLIGLVACGDDGSSSGSGGAGGAQGGAGGVGGAGGSQGGTGGTGGVPVTVTSTGSGGMAPSLVGIPCSADDECGPDGFCITEEANGWPSGYCSMLCEEDADCGGDTCIPAQTPFCLKSCAGTCRDGYGCENLGQGVSTEVCTPACESNDQCGAPRECITDVASEQAGLCVQDEVCDDGVDNDLDAFPDCSDGDCLADAYCAPLIEDACAAPDVGDGATGSVEGESLFQTECGAFLTGFGPEDVYAFTAPARGELRLSADPGAGLDLALYVRSDCDDAASVTGCADDAQDGAATETLTFGMEEGQAVSIFVDAYGADGEGDYVLDATFTPALCGDGIITLPETCDDQNVDAGDGCSVGCEVELDFYCASGAVVEAGTVSGTTASGTSFFSAPVDAELCAFGTGGGREVIYRYVPTATGSLSIILEPAGNYDLGLHVRSNCVDGSTQIGCADENYEKGAQEESLLIDVVEGVEITIFVDEYAPNAGGAFDLTIEEL